MTKQELALAFQFEGLTRSTAYDPGLVIENMMGPNVMWLTESLSQVMKLESGMRVLDMGCGKAVSSIFLAKEFGLQVWAADLWIDPSDNLERFASSAWTTRCFLSASRPTIFRSPADFSTPSSAWTPITTSERTICT